MREHGLDWHEVTEWRLLKREGLDDEQRTLYEKWKRNRRNLREFEVAKRRLAHELVTMLRIPQFVEWLVRRLSRL